MVVVDAQIVNLLSGCPALETILFHKFGGFRQLEINSLKILCILQFKEVPIPELECKHLVLELHLEKFNLYGAAVLLQASPLVETLNIEVENQPYDDYWCYFERRCLVKGDSIGLQSYISNSLFPNLKNVEIVISFGMCMKEHLKWEYMKKLFKLSDFLLENVVVLEKFVIVSNRRRCEICGIKCVSRFLWQLANKLRSSADSVIIFQENDKSLVKETSDSRWADLVEEEEHTPTRSNHEPKAEVSRRSPTATYDSDLGSEMFDKDDEDDMLDILFDKVAKDGDLSPRQQRSGSNKNKKKIHER
ncbi:hypothetical protein R3W88_029257 [Solanum pinnatisectum]|uniref:FBD domain-containing protein n=1 Tax=Solanum pinnatisectum TaxID=50273 RepID=A0AAV9K513_9SOLN|nr:hypothetical protein R3W88_029257 [Solanum pinnatisectum]